MKRIRLVVIKDLMISFRKKLNLLLFIASPLAVMFLMGSSFAQREISNIPIVVCAGGDTLSSTKIIDELLRSKFLDTRKVLDCSQVKTLTQSSDYKLGVIFPETFDSEEKIDIIVDNSDYRVSAVTQEFVIKILQGNSYNIAYSSLESLFATMGGIKDMSLKASDNLNNIVSDFGSVTQSFSQEKIDSSELIVYLDEIQQGITKATSDLNLMQNNIDNINLDQAQNNLANIRKSLEEAKSSLPDLSKYSFFRQEQTFDPQQITDAINQIDDISRTIDSFKGDLDNMKRFISDNQNYIVTLDSKIKDIRQEAINNQIYVNNALDEFVNKTNTFKTSASEIQKKNSDTTSTILSKLDSIEKRSPGKILKPLSYNIEEVWSDKRFIDFFSADLIVVMLLLSGILFSALTIYSEKQSGTLVRTFMTPISSIEFITGKVISLLILITIQFMIGLAVLQIFFRVQIFGSIALALVVLYVFSLTLIATGLIISFFSDSEKTTVTLSTAVIIISIFLSGSFVPFEGLPAFIGVISRNLPSSLTITILKDVLIYNQSIVSIMPDISLLAVYSLILGVISYIIFIFKKESYIISK